MFGRVAPGFLKIDTYTAAVSAFERTQPIRGKDRVYHGVPLRTSRRDHTTYRLTRPVEGGPVKAWMYDTPIVTVYPDDRLEVAAYDSSTTRQALNYLLPRGFSLGTHRGMQLLYVPVVNFAPHYIADTFTIDQQARQVHGLQRVHVKRVSRKRARAALQPYAEHIEQYEIWSSVFTSTRVAREFLRQHGTTAADVYHDLTYARSLDLKDPNAWVLMAAAEAVRPLNLLGSARQLIYGDNNVRYNDILPEGTVHKDARFADVSYSVSY